MPDKPRYVIVGSGPAGISATMALVRSGHHVTVLDVGDELDEEKKAVVSRMSRQRPEEWDSSDVEAISSQRIRTQDTVHSKRSYGSSFSFASDDCGTRVVWRGKRGFYHSHARGGLSNVWGAAMLPCRSVDIADWPVGLRELEPHYRAVMAFVPCTPSGGSLEDILPSYGADGAALEPCGQAKHLEDELKRSEKPLANKGIRFGKSRLAIRTGCQYCSLCLSGCPYGLIWSSAQTLRDLLATGNITYLKRRLVEAFRNEDGRVIISGKNLEDGSSFDISADRLFLAAGVLSSTTIVMRSLGSYQRDLKLLDSQYYIYPLLRLHRTDNVETEQTNTSAQLFMEIDDHTISPYGVHLQLYGYSAFLREELERTFLRFPLRSKFFRREFLGRLMVAQGYLHSRHSGQITLRLSRGADGNDRLECQARLGIGTVWKVLRVGWKLLGQVLLTKAIPLFPGVKIPTPGSSNHSGGSLPMRENPGDFETDTMGCLHGYHRVHIVDASVLPSIPATTVTFTLMANSHRIATLAQALDTE